MPKLKSNRGAAKRFRSSMAKKGFKCRHANRSHHFTDKPAKRKRQLRPINRVNASDVLAITRMLPYGN